MATHFCWWTPLLPLLLLSATLLPAEEPPRDEASVIACLQSKGIKITTDPDGHAVTLMSSGMPELTPAEYQLIGQLKHLQQMGLNAAPLKIDEWGFLHELPNLKQLSIWHGHHFDTLEPFCGLPVESLTIGGCMGLRDLNKDNPEQLRNAILTLKDLPRLKRGNWYHSPLIPDDSHLEHIATSFPQLEDLKLDFAAPRGSETSITPSGLQALQKLPLKVLSLENAGTFGPAEMESIAGVKTLAAVLIDARRTPGPTPEGLAALQKLRPDVTVVIANPGDSLPPSFKPARPKP